MAKNLDGIKKLNPEDIKKYRKIVLNYIGEKDSAGVPEQKNSNQAASSLRKIDGINFNKIIPFAVKRKSEKSPARNGQAGVSAVKEELAPQLAGREREAERLKEAIKRQEEEREKIKAEERQYQLKKEQAEKDRREREERLKQEKIKLEKEKVARAEASQAEIRRAAEAKKWEEKIKLEELEKEEKRKAKEKIRQEELKKKKIAEQTKREAEEIKRKEEMREYEEKEKFRELEKEEKRKIKENLRLEKMKRREELQRVKGEMKIARRAVRRKKKVKRQKAWRKARRNFNLKLNIFFSRIKQNIIYIILFLALFLAIIYLIFCLAVLRFNNNIVDWAAGYLPVPAVITSQGVISYLDYKKIENKNYLSLLEKKNYLAKWEIRRHLSGKYGLTPDASDEALAIRYVLDKDYNQVGLSRIDKINGLLQGQSGIGQFSKYADEYNGGAYYSLPSAVEKFGPAVLELAIGQVSQIMPRADGYYIVKRTNDKNSQLGLSYLFVNALTLDQYLSRESEKIRVFILAD